MPLTPKGKKLLRKFKQEYGNERGERVFYASANSGKITGVHPNSKKKYVRALKRKRRKNA